MAELNRTRLSALRGASRMAFDATAGLVDVVERMHSTIQQRPGAFGEAQNRSTHGITALVYRSVRGGVRLVGAGVDASLARVVEFLPEGGSGTRPRGASRRRERRLRRLPGADR
jgi:hypothetical protein